MVQCLMVCRQRQHVNAIKSDVATATSSLSSFVEGPHCLQLDRSRAWKSPRIELDCEPRSSLWCGLFTKTSRTNKFTQFFAQIHMIETYWLLSETKAKATTKIPIKTCKTLDRSANRPCSEGTLLVAKHTVSYERCTGQIESFECHHTCMISD